MKKSGFTLIELLAVIIILAIIALILIPIVNDVITSAGKASFKESVNGVIDSTNNYVEDYILLNNDELRDFPVVFSCDGIKCESNGYILTFKGNVPKSGNIIIYEDGVLAEYISDGKYCAYGYKWNMQIENDCASVDVNKPTITGVQDGKILKLTMSDIGSGIYGYCVTKGDECNYIKSDDYAEYTLSEIGTYQVYAKDKRGNISDSIEFVVGDVFEPTIPNIGLIGDVSGTDTTATIQTPASGSTDDTSDIVYKYLVTNDNIKPDRNDERFTTELTFERSCGTSYYAWAIAEDSLGNRSDVASLGSASDGPDSYSEYGTCSKTCGGGTQTRTNTCALVTTGLSQSCNTQACCSYTANQVLANFGYTGGVQTWTVPAICSGKYKLEVWGAQGGSISGYSGGKGGYSSGLINLNGGQSLYIVIGGAGTGATGAGQSLNGGYNGGGRVNGNGSINHINASGGGATHIATTNRGVLSNYNAYRSEVLIVAGGGGGARDQANHEAAARWGHGGGGGGISSSGTYSSYGTTTVAKRNVCLANQSSGYSFGQGESCTGNSGGGGGYMGGYSGGSGCAYTGTGNGGSGYIGGVTSASSYDGDTTFKAPSGSNEVGHAGHGYARITFISY